MNGSTAVLPFSFYTTLHVYSALQAKDVGIPQTSMYGVSHIVSIPSKQEWWVEKGYSDTAIFFNCFYVE